MSQAVDQKELVVEANADKNVNEPEQTLDEKLAVLVVEKLRGAQLILDGKQDEIRTKLSSGTVRQEDWKLWLDPALVKKEAGK